MTVPPSFTQFMRNLPVKSRQHFDIQGRFYTYVSERTCLSFIFRPDKCFFCEKLTMSIVCAITSTKLSILKVRRSVKKVQENRFYLANYEKCKISKY